MRTSPLFAFSLALGSLLVSGAAADSTPPSDTPAVPVTAPAHVAPAEPLSAAEAPRPTADELEFIDLVNRERVRRGLSRLDFDPLLMVVARKHSEEMKDKHYFNHQSPTPGIKTPMDRYLHELTSRPGYACVGENLFYCSIVDVQRGHNAFMNSPTHRENVLFPRFEKIGVGVVKNDRGEFWVTQMFLASTDPLLASRKTAKR